MQDDTLKTMIKKITGQMETMQTEWITEIQGPKALLPEANKQDGEAGAKDVESLQTQLRHIKEIADTTAKTMQQANEKFAHGTTTNLPEVKTKQVCTACFSEISNCICKPEAAWVTVCESHRIQNCPACYAAPNLRESLIEASPAKKQQQDGVPPKRCQNCMRTTCKCAQTKPKPPNYPGEPVLGDILGGEEQVFDYSSVLKIKKTGPAEVSTVRSAPRQRHTPEQKAADIKQKAPQDIVWPAFKKFVLVRDYLAALNQEIANLMKPGQALTEQQETLITQKAAEAGFSEKEAGF